MFARDPAPERLAERYRRMARSVGPRAARAQLAAQATRRDAFAALRAARCPTAVVCGTRTPCARPASTGPSPTPCPGPRCTSCRTPDTCCRGSGPTRSPRSSTASSRQHRPATSPPLDRPEPPHLPFAESPHLPFPESPPPTNPGISASHERATMPRHLKSPVPPARSAPPARTSPSASPRSSTTSASAVTRPSASTRRSSTTGAPRRSGCPRTRSAGSSPASPAPCWTTSVSCSSRCGRSRRRSAIRCTTSRSRRCQASASVTVTCRSRARVRTSRAGAIR